MRHPEHGPALAGSMLSRASRQEIPHKTSEENKLETRFVWVLRSSADNTTSRAQLTPYSPSITQCRSNFSSKTSSNFYSEDDREVIFKLRGSEAVAFMDKLLRTIDSLRSNGKTDQLLFRAEACLLKLSQKSHLLPTSFLAENVVCDSRDPSGGGGFADVYKRRIVRYHTSQFESPGDAKAIGKTQLRRTFLCGAYSFPCSATEYIFGTTKNPLVVGLDNKINSDKRIFGSDGNVTMILWASHSAHASNISLCIDSQILQRSLHPHAQAFVFVSAAISRSWP
ncbi:hypothetical protein DFH08DRAFT_892156 [Mycena albidolilacea]|uniref:Uncharacterized protein n=1 Tax=Mycena albidolilacea TaxID=1033008 RepID=A0AAD6ZDB1_9AGAR|nr:hypothetical protein DFH08DRAFT_892156 [Mycena albidolilacea]